MKSWSADLPRRAPDRRDWLLSGVSLVLELVMLAGVLRRRRRRRRELEAEGFAP